ncbi:exported protein of unknown function [Candidatus Filomicrobium marinum]|nr:exported protein of unknown function [Candidatus Filomicrobium marinum]
MIITPCAFALEIAAMSAMTATAADLNPKRIMYASIGLRPPHGTRFGGLCSFLFVNLFHGITWRSEHQRTHYYFAELGHSK